MSMSEERLLETFGSLWADSVPLEEWDGDGWRAVPVVCRFCGYRHWSVHPVGTDERALECPQCHLMEAEVVEE